MISYPPPPSQPPAPVSRKERRAATRAKTLQKLGEAPESDGPANDVEPSEPGPRKSLAELLSARTDGAASLDAVGMVHVDASGQVRWASPGALPLLGRSTRELLGTDLGELFLAPQELADAIAQARSTGRAVITSTLKLGDELAARVISVLPQYAEREYVGACLTLEMPSDGAAGERSEAVGAERGEHAAVDEDVRGQAEAINRTYAVIEFTTDGTILRANENFCRVMGYTPDELVGMRHAAFVDPAYADSDAYREFWRSLAAGNDASSRFKRRTKSGAEVWLEASYSPVFDDDGHVVRVVKFATDITRSERRDLDLRGQVAAIHRTHAVIEFDLEGNVLRINDLFTKVMGYESGEIVGRHHAVLVDAAYARSNEYREFWRALARGEHKVARFRRVTKGGKDVWLEASYNPILDSDGRPLKVVKFATDITEIELRDADNRGQMAAMSRVQAVVEFDLDGRVLRANDNFLSLMGYREREVLGKHHSMFVDAAERSSEDYRAFWRELARGRPIAQRFRRLTRDDREVWIQGSYNPVLDADGRVLKIVKFATDITAAVQAEAANLRYAAMAENAALGMMYADNDGIIRYLNPSCERVLRTVADHLPRKVEQIVGSNIDVFHRSPANTRRVIGDATQLPRRLKLKFGAQVVELEVSALFDKQRQRIGSMATWRLITDREAFRESTNRNTEAVAQRSSELSNVAREMTENAEYTANQADLVGSASNSVTQAVSQVATAAEQMSSTVREIAKNANEAARVAVTAVRAAEDTNKTVAQLGESSREIGKVIKTITSIAQQTNLLALNATIEAARAGEAGKGFAVVANEVKELAKQTAGATEDISRKIEAIQSDTRGAVSAIQHIGEIIGQINDFQNTIASAVEEQAATTNEIARNAADAATSSAMINANIGSVTAASRSASEAATNTLRSAEGLSQTASALRTALDQLEREI